MYRDSNPRDDNRHTSEPTAKNVYRRPQILHELELETRAGSPLGIPNPLDPAGLDPAE